MGYTFPLSEISYCIHLILHQGNQRRNNYCRTLADDSRQLVAHGFAASRRHYHKCVMTIENASNNCLLISFETVETEYLLQPLM